MTYVGSDKEAFRGAVGTYTWSNVEFTDERATVRWDAQAGSSKCRVRWEIRDEFGDPIAKGVDVAAGDREKGSKTVEADSYWTSTVEIKSTCPKWLITMASAPAPTEPPSARCDPNYEGACVPIVSYDLDCPDIGQVVYVVGSDPHRFDGDNDGVGCESYG